MRAIGVSTVICLSLASASALAQTVYFEFSNVTGNISGVVDGEIFGLSATGANQAATSIEILSAPAGLMATMNETTPFTLSTFAAAINQTVTHNSFTLSNGTVTAATVQISGGYFDIDINSNGTYYNQLVDPSRNDRVQNLNGFLGVTFSSTPFGSPPPPPPPPPPSPPGPPPVPEPRSLLLLGSGVAALLVARRRMAG